MFSTISLEMPRNGPRRSWPDWLVHPMEPVELSGELIAIVPLSAEHAFGLLAAADAEEVFAWTG